MKFLGLAFAVALVGTSCQQVGTPQSETKPPTLPATPPEASPTATPSTPPGIDRSRCGLPVDIREEDWPRTLKEVQTTEPDPAQEGTLTLAVLPDTQYYASCRERHFPIQGQWLADNIEARNILAAIHLGDLTEHNTPEEWEYVENALSPLFDKTPLILATGNHDYGDQGTADKRHTRFAQYFGEPKPATAGRVAETMVGGNVENAYYRVPLGSITLGVLVLEWSPRDVAVSWAKKAVAKYPDDRKIFVTHAYLFHDGTRYDFAQKGDDQDWNPLTYGTARVDLKKPYSKENAAPEGAYDGEMLWDALLSDMPGLFLTLNGHVLGDGAGVLTSEGKNGAKVHQVLTNFQMLDEGGLGYLRLIEISKDGQSMRMKTYSPSLKQFAVARDQHFVLPITPPLF